MQSPLTLPIILLNVLALAGSIATVSRAAEPTQTDEISFHEDRQIKLEDKLKEAFEANRPVTVLFGEHTDPDLIQLYQELTDKNIDSLILVINPELEQADSPLFTHIKEELNRRKGLNSAVFPLERSKSGSVQLGKATFNRWGYQNGIANDISNSAKQTKGAMDTAAGSASLPSTQAANPLTAATPQLNSIDATQLKHITITATTIKAARQELIKAATKEGLDLTRVNNRLDQFEKRVSQNYLDDKQVIATYETVEKLLSSQSNGPLFDKSTRNTLAELILHNLARPTSIDQGNHPTCNVTTLEVYMAARHPEIYADLVSQIAQSGSYKTLNGEAITPPKAALNPGLDESSYDINAPSMNKRNHASQIVQMTLVNGVYQTGRYHEKTDTKGNKVDRTTWTYIVGPPVKTYFRIGNGWAYTTDEDQLLDGNGKPVVGSNGKAISSPNLIGDDILEASEMVLGYKMPYLEAPYQITGQPWVYDLPTTKRLLKFKADGKLPLGVHTMGGMHVQTIHDVVEKNGECWILIDNQRGEKEDGWIKLDTLHKTQKSMNYQFTPSKSIP